MENKENMNIKEEHGESEIPKSYVIQSQLLLPFLPTPKLLIHKIFDEIELIQDSAENKILYDLGAGDGRVLRIAASKYGYNATGFEINRDLYEMCVKETNKLRAKEQEKIAVIRGDFFNLDLNEVDVVFIYATARSFKFMKHLLNTCKQAAVIVFVRYQPDEGFLNEIGLTLLKEIFWNIDSKSPENQALNSTYNVGIYRKRK